jgi:hypothetical protein
MRRAMLCCAVRLQIRLQTFGADCKPHSRLVAVAEDAPEETPRLNKPGRFWTESDSVATSESAVTWLSFLVAFGLGSAEGFADFRLTAAGFG